MSFLMNCYADEHRLCCYARGQGRGKRGGKDEKYTTNQAVCTHIIVKRPKSLHIQAHIKHAYTPSDIVTPMPRPPSSRPFSSTLLCLFVCSGPVSLPLLGVCVQGRMWSRKKVLGVFCHPKDPNSDRVLHTRSHLDQPHTLRQRRERKGCGLVFRRTLFTPLPSRAGNLFSFPSLFLFFSFLLSFLFFIFLFFVFALSLCSLSLYTTSYFLVIPI